MEIIGLGRRSCRVGVAITGHQNVSFRYVTKQLPKNAMKLGMHIIDDINFQLHTKAKNFIYIKQVSTAF